MAAPDLPANRFGHCPDTIRSVAMKGAAIAPRFARRQAHPSRRMRRVRWSRGVGLRAWPHNAASNFADLSQEGPLRSQ